MRNKDFFSHFLVIGTGTFINMFLGLLTTPIITRIVEPAEYGQLSVFTMYGGIAVMILCLGLDHAFIRYFYENDDIQYKSTLLSFCFRTSITSGVIFGIVFLLLLCTVFSNFEFSFKISIVLFFYVLSRLCERFVFLLFRVTFKSKAYSMRLIISKLLYILGVSVWFYFVEGEYLFGLCLSITLSILIPTVAGIFHTKQFWKSCPNVKIDKIEIIKYGLPFILSMGLDMLFQAIDKISLNYYHSYVEIGIYSSAISMVNIFSIIQSAFNTMWVPIRTEHYIKYPDDKHYFQVVNQLITVIMFFVGINLIFFKDFLILLLGKKYALAAHIMPFLIFHPVMYTISETTCIGIGYSKKSYLDVYVSALSCIINFAGNAVLVPRYAGKGAAISTGFSYIAFWAICTYLSNKYFMIDYKLKKFFIMTSAVCVLAFHGTFYETNTMTFVLYLICSVLLFVLYKDPIAYMYKQFAKNGYLHSLKFKKGGVRT